MVPVILLSDGYIANGSRAVAAAEPRGAAAVRRPCTAPIRTNYFVYAARSRRRSRATGSIPGTPGPRAPDRRHREGRADRQHLVRAGEPREADPDPRRRRSTRVAQEIGELDLSGAELRRRARDRLGRHLRRAAPGAASAARRRARSVSHAHLRWLSPLEPGLAKVIRNFKHVLVAELNMGQLRTVLRAEYLIDAIGLNKIQGLPFKVARGRSPRSRSCSARTATDERNATVRATPRRSSHELKQSSSSCRRRTSSPTRTSAGARAAATTRSSRRCSARSPSSASSARTRCSSRASAARAGSRTT